MKEHPNYRYTPKKEAKKMGCAGFPHPYASFPRPYYPAVPNVSVVPSSNRFRFPDPSQYVEGGGVPPRYIYSPVPPLSHPPSPNTAGPHHMAGHPASPNNHG